MQEILDKLTKLENSIDSMKVRIEELENENKELKRQLTKKSGNADSALKKIEELIQKISAL